MTASKSERVHDRPLCGARKRQPAYLGETCARPAGWGTEHVGSGKCKLHGGRSPGGPIVHGRYSLAHRQSLAEKAQRFLNDPAPGDLTAELALLRALLDDYVSHFGEGIPMRAEDVQFIASLIREVGAMVERVARILNRSALTAAEVRFLAVRMADILVTYVDDPHRRTAALDELSLAVGVGPEPSAATPTGAPPGRADGPLRTVEEQWH